MSTAGPTARPLVVGGRFKGPVDRKNQNTKDDKSNNKEGCYLTEAFNEKMRWKVEGWQEDNRYKVMIQNNGWSQRFNHVQKPEWPNCRYTIAWVCNN